MIARDKLLHLLMGIATVAAMLLLVMVQARFGLGPALALATTLMGVGYEAQQRYRGEGQVEWQDALATAAPGLVAWAGLAALGA